MNCDIASLLGKASCFQCLSPGEWGLIKLALYCRMVNGITTPCDIATLLSEAQCFQCLPPGQQQLARLAMLCTLAQGGGTSPIVPVCDLTTALSGLWKMEDASNAPRLDSSGNNNTLADNLSDIPQVAGHNGFAANFTAIHNQALIGTTSASIRLGANDPYTLAVWINPNAAGSRGGIIRSIRPGAQTVFQLSMPSPGLVVGLAFGGGFFGGGGNQLLANTFGPLPINAWTFVLAEVNPPAGTAMIRINDSVQDNFAGAPFTNVNGGIDEFIEVGFDNTVPGTLSNDAIIDEVRFYKNRLLTPTEQTCLFQL